MAAGDKAPGESRLGSRKKDGKRLSNHHEAKLASTLSGVRQPNSGALDHRKGDILIEGDSVMSSNRFLLESKQCMGSTLILNVKDMVKICREAMEVGKSPGMVLTFGSKAPIVPAEWVMIPLDVMARLLQGQKEDK